MTDRQKVKHACAVISSLEERFGASIVDNVQAIVGNIKDLRILLEKPHKTDSKVSDEPSQMAQTLSKRLYANIIIRKSNYREPNWPQWFTDMDKILRLDKRTPNQLEEVIDWCQQDEFWQDNILSPGKLRKQLDKLEMRMSKDRNWQRSQRLRRPASSGKSAKEKYLESLNAKNTGDDG
jgi:hypothetical protein